MDRNNRVSIGCDAWWLVCHAIYVSKPEPVAALIAQAAQSVSPKKAGA
jgi:hypothetical protein